MKPVADFCKELKCSSSPVKKHLDRPVAFWSELDRYNDTITNAFVIILKTKGCSWAQESGCTMCGYFNDSALTKVTDKQLLNQFHRAMESYSNESVVKIFTSGSFFDPQEIPISVRDTILSELKHKTKKTAVESRPEYIKKSIFDDISDIISPLELEIGIGLETRNDTIRKTCINKGFTYKDYTTAVHLLKKYNHLIKTYVLLKPPFLTEHQSIYEAIHTINTIKDITNSISLNPTNVQRRTLVEYLWKRQYYRPPWLWSVIKVLFEASQLTSKRIQCDIVGGGSKRGAHNCKKCDKSILHAIRKFSLSKDITDLDDTDCNCKKQWEDQLTLEPLSYGSLVDIQRGLIT